MEFGLMTEPQMGMTYDQILDVARYAERAGLAAFCRSDHYSFPRRQTPHATDALATLAGLARDTARIDLVVLVSPITFRHPAVIAKMAATIDEMSGGRLVLGLGTGWMEAEHTNFGIPFFDQVERFNRLEDALGYLSHAFGRLPGPYHGTYYRLEDSELRPLPTGRLPILIGGSGERRTPRLAGTYADEYNFLLPADVNARIGRARAAAMKAGRDPSALRVSVMTPAIVGGDAAGFKDVLVRMADEDPMGRDATALEARYRERGLPVGTGEEVGELLATLTEAGVSRFYLQHFGPFDHDLLDEMFGALRAAGV
jgi:alkanesulfonate monooxygenase SsuD/methylene tetrahydromethanopterin reductase-like flavin-dependent oxidoreductase (luciferase family)